MARNLDLASYATFCGLRQVPEDFDRARVVFLPVPFDATTSYQGGAKAGPTAILAASVELEMYDEELARETTDLGFFTLPPVAIAAGDPALTVERAHQVAKQVLAEDKFLVTLGGEHTAAIGSIWAYADRFPDLSVLQIDAHADLRDSYQDTPFSHATAARRMRDRAPVVGVGIRSMCAEDAAYIARTKHRIFFARDIVGRTDYIPKVLATLSDTVYITIDIDGLDPSIMPATGTPEPGGLGWYDTLTLLRRVCEAKKVVGFDVTELRPLPGNGAPDFLVAKLIYRLIGYAHR